MKAGVLKQDTFIYLQCGLTLVARKGARVTAERGELKVEGVPFTFTKLPLSLPCRYKGRCPTHRQGRCRGVEKRRLYFARGEDGEPPLRVVFPEGGRVPYPFSLL